MQYVLYMDTFDQEIIKTLELLAYKTKESDLEERYIEGPLEDQPLEILVCEDDLKLIGMNRYSFCCALQHIEKTGHIIITSIIDPNKVDLNSNYFDPYEHTVIENTLILSIFKVTVSSSIFDVLEHYKKGTKPKVINKNPTFNNVESVLSVEGFDVRIALQDKETNEHKILKYIFITNDDIGRDYDYEEIAENEFGELSEDYILSDDGWRRYQTACSSINKKVREASNNKVREFLIFNASKSGKVRINPEYLSII